MRATSGLAALLLAASVSTAVACEPGLTPIFACEAARGRKFIQLCAELPLSADSGSLQYRFGRLDSSGIIKTPELEFPGERAGSHKRFFGATYTLRGVYTQSVRFLSGGYSYTVFTRTKGSQLQEAGVEVRALNTGKVATVSCTERPRFYIHELRGALVCDPQTPVGRACIE